MPTALATMNTFYHTEFGSLRQFAAETEPHNLTSGVPTTGMRHRYIEQDVPFGLVPLFHFGTAARVGMKAVQTLIHMASVINKTDYMSTGYSSEALGLVGRSVDQIMEDYGVPAERRDSALLMSKEH